MLNKIKKHRLAHRLALAAEMERNPPKVHVSWLAKEYPYHEKSIVWFIVASMIILSLVIYGLMTDGWTFSMALIVASGAYYVSHHKQPEIVTMSVTDRGIKVGRHFLGYESIKHFWIVHYQGIVQRLYIRQRSKVATDILIDIDTADMADIRAALKKYIPEHDSHDEPFMDTLIRLFRL